MTRNDTSSGGSLKSGTPAGSSPPHRLVWDPQLERWLAQSPGRMHRRELTQDCPFCADITHGKVPADAQAWLRPNDFPPLTPPDGECHILVYSRDHSLTFADLPTQEARAVVTLWRQTYTQLAAHYPVVMTWETCGEAIGQTQRHPHGQAYGLSKTPDTLRRELHAADAALAEGKGCLWCAMTDAENDGPRTVETGEHWLGFVPTFARYPYEVHFHPRRHISTIDEATDAEAEELATILPKLIRALNTVFSAPMPYMLALHQLADERYHFHIEVLPVGRAPGKLKLAASAEAAWGFWLNDSFPEEKAAELRAALAGGA